MVTIYTKPGCGECIFTKKYLDNKGVPYKELNITESRQYIDEVMNLGFKALPVVVGPNVEAFSGFKPDFLDLFAKDE